MLSAFLRIADELHIEFERAPFIIYEVLKPKDPISKEEWEKNQNVSGVTRLKEDLSQIKVTATCKSPKIHRALKGFEIKVQDELLKLPDYLHSYKDFYKELPVRIDVDITPEGYKPYDIKFSLKEREITQLLMGEKLYEQKGASLRELLQNSVDACRMRRELLKKEGLDYKPEVTFELTPDGKLIVSDNGSGMNEDIVENYFAQIGRCFYTSPDFLTQDLEFTPVSRFGIGILSCFMVADKLEIETKKEGSEPLLIEIDNTFDYFFVREGRRKDIGTTVTLFLKEEVRKEIEEGEFELEKIVQRYARHLEFPVKVKVPEKEPVVIEDKGHDCDILMKELSSPKLFWHKKHYFKTPDRVYEKTYHAVHINEEDMNGIICISLAPLYHHLSTGEILISKEGIFLDKEFFFPLLVGVFADINIKGDILDLNISRSDMLKNVKYDKLKSCLGDWIFKGLKDFFEEFRGTQTPLGRLDFNLLLEKYKIFHPWPDSFMNLAREYFDFLVFMKEGICKMEYKELKERKVKIVFIGASFLWPGKIKKQFISYFEEIVKSCSGFKEDEFYILDRVEDICIFLGKPPVSDERVGKILDEVPNEILEFLSSFFEMEESNNLCEVISPSIKRQIKFVKFKNYRTKRFIEDFLVEQGGSIGLDMRIRKIYLNAEHKFSKLLTNKRDAILRDKNAMKITENLFKSILKLAKIMSIYEEILVRGYGESYEGILGNILENQKQLLRWFVKKDLISEEEMSDYELRKEDFPPIWF